MINSSFLRIWGSCKPMIAFDELVKYKEEFIPLLLDVISEDLNSPHPYQWLELSYARSYPLKGNTINPILEKVPDNFQLSKALFMFLQEEVAKEGYFLKGTTLSNWDKKLYFN